MINGKIRTPWRRLLGGSGSSGMRVETSGVEERPELQPLGTVSCPLCGRLTRVTYAGLLDRHTGTERAVDGIRVLDCAASGRTLLDAGELARQQAAEVDALRLRAHP
jgi:hypothetical protein